MLQKKYQSTPDAIASYDYVDIADGTGVRVFYAADLSGASILTPNTFYSRLGHTYMTANDTKTDTFDVAFNSPVVVKGNIKVNIPIGIYIDAGAPPGALVCSGAAAVYHYDGTTETLLGSCSDQYVTSKLATDDTSEYYIFGLSFDVAQKAFKKGEILRLKSTFTSPIATATLRCFMAHDPKNRTDLGSEKTTNPMAWGTTQQTIHIPFLLNI